MRVERALVVVLCIIALEVAGCGGRLAYNLPPSSRLMEPGPGVGGPGPGVIPPGGGGYFGAGVGRFGGGMGGGTDMGGYGAGTCGPCVGQNGMPAPNNMMPAPNNGMQQNNGVQQAGFNSGCGDSCQDCAGGGCMDGGCADGSCGCGPGGGCCPIGPGVGGGCGMCGGAGCGLCGGGGCGLLGHLGGHGGCYRPGSMEASAGGGGAMMATSQVAFLGSEGVQVSWDVGGYGMFDSEALVIPGRQDFYQGAIYRLKLTNIAGRPGVELYPTLEIAPVTPRTDAYLAHAPIPVQFTEEDFDQVLSGNFVTKVIYLPDPEFQELALAGVETLVSTRLDPGVDPIAEADRRGSILAILRMGNKDLETGDNGQFQSQGVVPAAYNGPSGTASHAVYNQEVNAAGQPKNEAAVPAQYCQGDCGPYGAPGYCGPGYGGGGMGNMPVGAPTSGFAPPAIPPNMVAGAPQWGMPITGTPIGLPGPPHIPLGSPAGLQKHVMKNRTRITLPPPVSKVHVSVKQRPGLNYPEPVNHVKIDETQREPFRIIPGWVSGLFSGGGKHGGGGPYGGGYGYGECQ